MGLTGRAAALALGLGLGLVACGGPPAAPPISHRAPAGAPVERWFAVGLGQESLASGGLAIGKVEGDRIVVVADELPGGQFGWLDERTLLVVEAGGLPDASRVTTYVEGRRMDDATVTEREWPGQHFVELALTRSNEAWLSTCVLKGHECTDDRRYLRIAPAPRREAAAKPPGLQPGRVNDRDANPWPLPPAAPRPPAGAALSIGEVAVDVIDPYAAAAAPTRGKATGVVCEVGGARATYPRTIDGSWGPDTTARTARWIGERPTLLEITEDSVNPAGYHHVDRIYARPCDAPFDSYAYLGDDRWASFALDHHDPPVGMGPGEPPRLDGDWTFHRGDAVIGKLHGVARLRPNVLPPAP